MKRLLFTFKLLAILLVVDACLKCDEDVLPYYDFKSVTFSYWYGQNVPTGESFTFGVDWDKRVYLANRGSNLNLISSAMATEKCPANGDQGLKYAIDSLHITSSADWDIAHPAGSLLNDLVYFKQIWDSSPEDYQLLLSEDPYNPTSIKRGNGFQIKSSPSEDQKHVFHFTYYKSNGETVEGSTDTITWIP